MCLNELPLYKLSLNELSLNKLPLNIFSSLNQVSIRHDWTILEVNALFVMPFSDLMFQAQTIHRQNFNPNQV
jgi:biotin synthase